MRPDGSIEPGHASSVRALRTAATSKARRHRRRDRILILLVLALGLGTALAVTVGPSSLRGPAMQPADPASGPETRTGSIVVLNADRCRQTVFDNDTGRTLEAGKPCAGPILDANGAPNPVGTAKRLHGISKSFRNQ